MNDMILFDEIAAGEGLGLGQAAKLLPGRGGKAVAPSTLGRWHASGAKGKDGKRVRLAAASVGGRLITSRGALSRFLAALNGAEEAGVLVAAPKPAPAPAARQRQHGQAMAELEKAGVA